MRGEDYVRASKSTFYDFILCDTIKKIFRQNFTRFSQSDTNDFYSVDAWSSVTFSTKLCDPWIIRECQIGKPRSAVLETEGRAILGTFQARLRESIRSSNSDPTLLRPPQKANSLRFVRTNRQDRYEFTQRSIYSFSSILVILSFNSTRHTSRADGDKSWRTTQLVTKRHFRRNERLRILLEEEQHVYIRTYASFHSTIMGSREDKLGD